MSSCEEQKPDNCCDDLPLEDRTSVLLLGVTRLASSPPPARRPSSLALTTSAQRRSSYTARRAPVRRSSSASSIKRRPAAGARPQRSTNDGGGALRAQVMQVTPARGDAAMDRSVDSIGTCSLDVDASADLSDWSEASSGGTLRSATLSPHSQHLPSYLSLACTVNGYSTTTNYDPIRLARSRDTSPHRFDHHDPLAKTRPSPPHANPLSPPNLVPLPTLPAGRMADRALAQLHRHRHFRTPSPGSKQAYNGHDKIDACTAMNLRSESCCYEQKTITITNGVETSKSFIQQRVERLYGPGALAQGFFVSKKQQFDDSSVGNGTTEDDSTMRQSASSPALPVLRLLTPEFRKQLPKISPRKNGDSVMQKSSTLPTLSKENGVKEARKEIVAESEPVILEESGAKNGHYYLRVLQNEANRLLQAAGRVEAVLDANEDKLSEENIGKIRSAAGKARLLVTQKMQQFRGLCTNNITQSGSEAFPTTNEDLQGFWDMVMLQVVQVDALIREIDDLKANNWVEVKVEPVSSKTSVNGKVPTKKLVSRVKVNAGNEEARKKREVERRQMIEERRRAMKAQNGKASVEGIEIFVPESS